MVTLLPERALAHHPEQLAFVEVEAHAVDRVDDAVPDAEAGADVLHLQDLPACRRLGPAVVPVTGHGNGPPCRIESAGVIDSSSRPALNCPPSARTAPGVPEAGLRARASCPGS